MIVRIWNNIHVFWVILALPAAFMAAALVRDPAAAFDLIHSSGEVSVRLLVLALGISPLRQLLGPRRWILWLVRRRRAIGVAAFGYAVLHLTFYLLDMVFWDQIVADAMVFSIWTGYLALAIFALMALTSNDGVMRLLRANWKRLQRLVYAAAVLTAVHWIFVDGEVRGAIIHFVPLIILEIARMIHIFTKRHGQLRKPVP